MYLEGREAVGDNHFISSAVHQPNQARINILKVTKEWIHALKRLVSPPSGGEEDTLPSEIPLSQFNSYCDKKTSPNGGQKWISSIAWLSRACKRIWYLTPPGTVSVWRMRMKKKDLTHLSINVFLYLRPCFQWWRLFPLVSPLMPTATTAPHWVDATDSSQSVFRWLNIDAVCQVWFRENDKGFRILKQQ